MFTMRVVRDLTTALMFSSQQSEVRASGVEWRKSVVLKNLSIISAIPLMFVAAANAATELSCEDGARTMFEVSRCLEERSYQAAQSKYDQLWNALISKRLVEAADALDASQVSWRNSTEQSCLVLKHIAEPSWGLYSNDLMSNCRADKVEQRVNELHLL